MCTTDSLIACIGNFFRLHRTFQFSFIVVTLATFLQLIAFSTSSWVQHESASQGLWTHCSSGTLYECCQSAGDFHNGTPDWLHGSRVFQTFGLLGSFSSFVIVVLFPCCHYNEWRKYGRLSAALAFLFTTLSLLIGISIYGGQFRSNPSLTDYKIAGSCVCSIFALIGFLISFILMIFVHPNNPASVHPAETGQPFTMTQPQPASVTPSPSCDQPPSTTICTHPPESMPSYPYPEPTAPPAPEAEPSQPIPNNNANDADMCIVCWENEINTLFEPCAHRRCCDRCAEQLPVCPMCRVHITQRRRVY